MAKTVIPASMKSSYDNFHFAPAVIDGDRIFCSGQLGTGADGKISPDPETQFAQAFENVSAILAEAGASMADVIEISTFHIGLAEHMRTFMKVKDRFVAEPYPAWTAVGTPELAFPGALVEVKVIARKP